MLFRSLLTVLLLALAPSGRAAGSFVPAELYRYQTLLYPNGFRVVVNPRSGARNVAFRLVADVGLLDYDCRARELPHLAEHLLFSGPDNLTESDLDAEVAALGGTWNAYTHPFKTEYQLDVYAGHALQALEILHRMFTRTQLTDARVETATRVLAAESGGAPGLVRGLLYRYGVGTAAVDAAYRAFVPDSRAFCDRLPEAGELTRDAVEDFIGRHYVPESLVLIAVGDIDVTALDAFVARTFGSMLPGARPVPGAAGADRRAPSVAPALTARAAHRVTRLAPAIGNTALVSIDLLVGQPALLGPEHFALEQLAGYLDARLYDLLRVQRGLAYTPTASLVDQGDFSTLLLEAEVDPEHASEALELMQGLLAEVRRDGIDRDTLAESRRGILYRLAAELNTNASFADLYLQVSERFGTGAGLPDLEANLLAYDADSLRIATAAWLAPDRALVFESIPILTPRTLGWSLICVIAMVVAGVAWSARKASIRSTH